MKVVAALPFAAALAVALAGCGTGVPHPAVTITVTASPRTTQSAKPAAVSASAAANERLLAEGLAESIPVIPAQVVGSALMRAYARFQHAYGAAWGAAGQPNPSGSVTQIAGGFKVCWPETGNGPNCQALTQFTTNHTGQITGVSVNGKPLAGHIATAPATTSGGLTISGVVAYGAQNLFAVAFKLTDRSYRPVNINPALLASLSGASDDQNQTALPTTLAPGDSLYAAAGFDVSQGTGLFCLQPNDGLGEHLPCTKLNKV